MIFSLAALTALPVFAAETPLFRLNGTDYTEAQLPASVRSELYQLEQETYQKKQHLLDAAVLEVYLAEEAKRLGKDNNELAAELLKIEEPDEFALQEFYDTNKERIKDSFEQVRERIKQYLMQQQYQQKQLALLLEIKKKQPFELLLPQPEAPRFDIATDGFPSTGKADAKVTIVEFADYLCPHCRDAHSLVKKILEKYPDQVKLVFMDQPFINRAGLESRSIAEGAVCADQQGKFWEYHDYAFDHQAQLQPGAAQELAKQVGLDEAAFSSCLDSAETKAKVARAKTEANRLGATSTPTFFVNGRQVVTDDVEAGLSAAIDAALKTAGS
jgi:protein-disulfide isomerase